MQRISLILIPAFFPILACMSSCSFDPDTYLRFSLDGQTYETKGAEFSVNQHGEVDGKFIMLETLPHGAFPDGSFQWWMKIQEPDELVDRTIDLSDSNDPELKPIMQLSISKDLGIHHSQGGRLTVTITALDGNTISGRFTGKRLIYTSMTIDNSLREVEVTGTFVAKLIFD